MKTKNLILICLALISALQLQAQGTIKVEARGLKNATTTITLK